MNRISTFWADWASCNERGYSRASGPTWDDTRIPGNMVEPLSYGYVYVCDICGQEYEVPDCIFMDNYHVAHMHGREYIVVQTMYGQHTVNENEVKNFNSRMNMAMEATILMGISPLELVKK